MKTTRRLTILGVLCALAAAPAWADDPATPPARTAPAVSRLDGPFRILEAGPWRLELSLLGTHRARLIGPSSTAGDTRDGVPVYEGRDLAAILAANSALRSKPAVQSLQRGLVSGLRQMPTRSTWYARAHDGDLAYETWRGAQQADLVRSGARGSRLFAGKDLATILAAHADLAKDPAAARIRKLAGALADLDLRQDAAPDPATQAPAHLFLDVTPNGMRATVWQKGADGTWASARYAGTDFPSIRSANPALAKLCPLWMEEPDASSAADAREDGPVDVAYLGVTLREQDAAGDGTNRQIVVTHVDGTGRGHDVGLRVGDVLQSIDGTAVSSLQDVRSVFERKSRMKSTDCKLVVERDGRRMTLQHAAPTSSGR
jgi:hypothetical protein